MSVLLSLLINLCVTPIKGKIGDYEKNTCDSLSVSVVHFHTAFSYSILLKVCFYKLSFELKIEIFISNLSLKNNFSIMSTKTSRCLAIQDIKGTG